jgi:cytochrome c biogenesis protein CcdA/thiol-disulfide isomerase/thioredoxin
MLLLILFAFIGGVVTILSPCILPILPLVLSSSVVGGKKRPLGVVTGFILSFTFFTLFLTSLVKIVGIPADSLRTFSVVVILLFGVSIIIPSVQLLIEKLFTKLSRFTPKPTSDTGFVGGLLVGLSIGLIWTPCVGPILASVISLAITGSVTGSAFFITLAYAIGTAIPMLAIVHGGRNLLTKVPWLTKNTQEIQRFFGFLMILTAVGIHFNVDREFQVYILDKFPNYGAGLTSIEDNDLIRNQLDDMTTEETENEKKPDMKAPEIISGGEWFNLPPGKTGLTLEELKGKVVVVDFWTYTCINCIRTLPYLRDWYENYTDDGLVIIGVHSPEFEFEKSSKNVAKAISTYNLTYPIVQDNNFATWKAYKNRYWPAKYIIDKDGYIRYTHFGEGAYDKTEEVIRELLEETGAETSSKVTDRPQYKTYSKTPEIYLGYGRISNFASPEKISRDKLATYTTPTKLDENQVAFNGDWAVMDEYSNPQKGANLYLNFESKEVFLVMRTTGDLSEVRVYVDDKPQYFGEDNQNGLVIVDSDRLYKLINLPSPGKHILRLEFLDSEVEVFAFTFG